MARWATRVARRPRRLGAARHGRDADPGRAGTGDAHLAAGLLGAAGRADHPQGLRPRRRRVRSRCQRSGAVRRRRRPRSTTPTSPRWPTRSPPAMTSRRSRRCSPHPTGRCGSSRPSRRSGRPTSGRPAWSTTCAPRSRPVSRSPAPRRCSPTSPSCSATRLWLVVGFVVGVSVLLLGMVFRSVVVPRQGRGDEPALDRRGVRRADRDLPVGLGRRAARPRPRDAGLELDADPAVRRAVRPVDGLRGVPALADPRGLAGHRRRHRAASSAASPRPGGSSPPPPRSWSPSSWASPPRSTSWSSSSASAWPSRSRSTRRWSGWCSCRPR